MFAILILDGVLGPPSVTQHKSLFLCSSRSNARGKVEGHSKNLLIAETETRELLGGTEEKIVSPTRGH